MVNEQLISWIKENQAKGLDLESLRNQLLQSGWSQSDIDEAINAVISETPVPADVSPPPGKPSFKEKFLKKEV